MSDFLSQISIGIDIKSLVDTLQIGPMGFSSWVIFPFKGSNNRPSDKGNTHGLAIPNNRGGVETAGISIREDTDRHPGTAGSAADSAGRQPLWQKVPESLAELLLGQDGDGGQILPRSDLSGTNTFLLERFAIILDVASREFY